MIAEFGHIALIAALLVAGLQAGLPLWGASRNNIRFMQFGDRAALIQFGLILIAFMALTAVFLTSDFSVKLAATHSHTAKPLIYKISGVWGNHEGSMLLWMLMLALFGALVPIFGKNLPMTLKARAIGVQGLLGIGFLAFILFTSNPFERLNPVPLDGLGLNPLLQDPGLALHPPFLYLGYVGFSMAFSFSVAALIEGRVDAIWARWLRPWVLLAWSFLTIGITIGSFWAYYELGWGGWWMWDPVENVSFMPWLAGTALLHSVLVLGTRHIMASWTVLLGITAFSLSLIGTFVVRSGVLVSVHSFAVDPARGVFILALLVIATGSALTLYALRANTLRSDAGFKPLSREGGLLLNNILLVIATATVFLGTFYPLFIDAISREKISVGAPYFDLTFGPIMCGLIAVMAFAPLLKWRDGKWNTLKRPFIIALILAFIISILTLWIGKSVLGGLSLSLAAILALGTIISVGRKSGWSMARLLRQPAATYGFVLGHLGVAIFTVGVTIMSVWADDEVARLKIGETATLGKYEFTLRDIENGQQENYQFQRGVFDVKADAKPMTKLASERRYYPVREMFTTEAGLDLSPTSTVFASLSEGDAKNGWVVRVYYHPYVVWIWIGALIMALAGFVSLFDRRLRFTRDTQ